MRFAQMNNEGVGDRVRALFAVALVADGSDHWRRHTVVEAAEHVGRTQPPTAGLDVRQVARLLDEALTGRVRELPEPVLAGLTGFFGVPPAYFGDEQVARTADATLLDRSFARLGVDAVALCRTGASAERHRLLALVLDSVLAAQ